MIPKIGVEWSSTSGHTHTHTHTHTHFQASTTSHRFEGAEEPSNLDHSQPQMTVLERHKQVVSQMGRERLRGEGE